MRYSNTGVGEYSLEVSDYNTNRKAWCMACRWRRSSCREDPCGPSALVRLGIFSALG